MTKRILFVDDDRHILNALRRMLRPRRHEWEMRFASSSAEALELLEQGPTDVLVSDVRMAGGSGLELLARVHDQHPDVVRIILSGQPGEATSLGTDDHIQQYLTKPCDPETLRTTIERTFALRERISSPTIIRSVAGVNRLPPAPPAYRDLMLELQMGRGSAPQAAAIIARDPALTAKLLQVVNSAFVGVSRQISDPLDAVQLLGLRTVRALVMSAGTFAQVIDTRFEALAEQVWRHSVLVGAAAAAIARAQRAETQLVEFALNAGLLHDVGKLVLAMRLSDDYVGRVGEGAACTWEVEEEVYEVSHPAAAGYLLSVWGLSDPLIEVVVFHHRPRDFSGGSFVPLTAVHAGNALVHRICGSGTHSEMDTVYLERWGLSHRIDEWDSVCRMAIAKALTRY